MTARKTPQQEWNETPKHCPKGCVVGCVTYTNTDYIWGAFCPQCGSLLVITTCPPSTSNLEELAT